MISFLFPEDLDPRPSAPVHCSSPPSKKCRDAFPAYQRVGSAPPAPSPAAPRRAPPPPPPLIALPKPKKEPVVCVSSVDAPKLARSGSLMRFKSLSRSREERDARKRVKAEKAAVVKALQPLSPVVDEEFWRTGRYDGSRDQFAYVAF